MGTVPPRPILPSSRSYAYSEEPSRRRRVEDRVAEGFQAFMAVREEPIQHIDFDALPISEYTGLPYDPELISYPLLNKPPAYDLDVTIGKDTGIGLGALLGRLFRKREKARPKQDHVSLFEALPDGPYSYCENCRGTKENDVRHICIDRLLIGPA